VILTLHDYWLSCPRDGQRRRADGTLCSVVDHGACALCLADSPHLVPAVERGALTAARRAGLGPLLHEAHRRAPWLTTTLMRWVRRAAPLDRSTLVADLDTRDAHLRSTVARLDALLAPTRFAYDRALEWGAPAGALRVVTLGAIPGPTHARPAAPRPRLGYLGTLAPHKGVHVLIEAVRGLTATGWTLDVFGNPALDPSYAGRLESLAAGDARIRWRGPVSPEHLATVWSAVDLLVLPSLWWENSPLTALEALAAGRPVIASHIGGVPEVIPEGAGVLVPPGDVSALREALAAVLAGRVLAEPLAALPLKTTRAGAAELVSLYEDLRSRRAVPERPAEAP
jgi:glycosyltransferase involved in cell wall biosynthesis